jgi:predicted alpha/beta-hydrolase family hydrolase
MESSEPLTFAADGHRISALLTLPNMATAVLALAHGAGAGMRHPFLATMARLLSAHGIGTLRYQFPYMEAGRKRVDPPALAHAAVRAAVALAAERAPSLPLFAGGKSFGGRMTSQAAAEAPLAGVRGIVFFGFPLHPPGRPESATERGAHLGRVTAPMLFLQGTRDEFAELSLLEPLVESLGKRSQLYLIDGANHSFKVPAASGRKDADVRAELADVTTAWIGKAPAPRHRTSS